MGTIQVEKDQREIIYRAHNKTSASETNQTNSKELYKWKVWKAVRLVPHIQTQISQEQRKKESKQTREEKNTHNIHAKTPNKTFFLYMDLFRLKWIPATFSVSFII